jgi:predicted Rossmann fold nucleotide-binding protein DprA/Smf involved in DNA uptake
MIGSSGQIFVLPQQNSSAKLANNWLIKQGAKLVENSFDILNEF